MFLLLIEARLSLRKRGPRFAVDDSGCPLLLAVGLRKTGCLGATAGVQGGALVSPAAPLPGRPVSPSCSTPCLVP